MRLAWLPFIVLCASACTDLVTTEIGEGSVAPIEIERSVSLPATAPQGCPTATIPITWPDARAASVSIAPGDAGCEVTVRASEVVVVERATVEAQAQEIGDFDETALVGIDLELVELEVTDDAGASLGAAVRDATVSLDGQPLFESVGVGAQSPRARGTLPEATVAEFREALAEPQDVRGDLELRFTFTGAKAIPEQLDVRIVLQPILLVDVLRAAL